MIDLMSNRCNMCNEILSDEYTYVEPDMVIENGDAGTNDIFAIDSGSYYLCNECANKLIKGEMNK